jgi:DNA-binding transcriptional LysR family regulator
MRREDLTDLYVFLAVAEERSFIRGATRLGLTQSTPSHAIRSFEERLGVWLLTQTTRSVARTEAGERLLRAAKPGLEANGAELSALTELRDKPAGMVRITTSTHAYETILRPALSQLLHDSGG